MLASKAVTTILPSCWVSVRDMLMVSPFYDYRRLDLQQTKKGGSQILCYTRSLPYEVNPSSAHSARLSVAREGLPVEH